MNNENNELINQIKEEDTIKIESNKSNKRKRIIGVVIGLIVLITGICINEELKIKRDLANIQATTKEAITQESTRYSIIISDLEGLKSEVLSMSTKYLDAEHKTTIIANINALIDDINKKDISLYKSLKAVSDSFIDTGAYMSDDKVDDYLNKFTYMLESLAITSRISLDEATTLSDEYTKVIQTLGINMIIMDFVDSLKES